MSNEDIGKKQNPSLKDSIENPLLLNQSMKESVQGFHTAYVSPIVRQNIQSIKQQQDENLDADRSIKQQPLSTKPTNQLVITEQPRARNLNLNENVVTEQAKHQVQQMNQTITSQPEFAKIKGQRKYQVMQACGAVCVLIGFVLIFAFPPFLESIIKTQAIDQVVMGPQNQGLWAHFPGDTNTIITRNFTFFKLLNEDDYLLRHKKPKFQQISDFKIQELEDYVDITYLEDGNKVKVRDWLRFVQWSESKDLNTTVNILNMGNIGYWSTLKLARPTLILQQGLALLFTNMQQAILPTLLGTGINSQFIPNKTSAVNSLFLPAGVQSINHDFLWSDPAYGLNSPQNLGQWAAAALQCFQNPTSSYQYSVQANVLKNYFALSESQVKIMMTKIYTYVTALKQLLVENHYCAGMNMSDCTGRYLAVAQMTDGMVSARPPPVSTITPNDTICDNNNTCINFYPQLYAFEKNVYWGGKQPSTNIAFNRSQISAWFDYNKTVTEGVNYNTAEDCLLHIGNLDQLWEWGSNYDKDEDESAMDKIRDRLKLENSTQAKVVWEWLKYMAKEFVLQGQHNDKLGVANLFTQGFYEQFALLQDKLQPFLLQKMIKEQIVECHVFFESTLQEEQGSDLVSSLCKQYDVHSEQFVEFIVSTCQEQYGPAWLELRSKGVSLLSMNYHCQNNGKNNLGSMLHRAKVQLDQKYHCSSTPNPYCSNFEIAAKQWANSTVTLDPPTNLPPGPTFHFWDPKVKAFEYGFFLQKFSAEERIQFPVFGIEQLYSSLTFEQWYSAPVVLRYFVSKKISEPFLKYIRWFAITITLNGVTMNRTVRQILFGYEDQYLAQIKNTYPPFGGDPSAPSVIALNDLNLTNEQSNQTIVFKTGKQDFRDVYQYYEINGLRYLANNYSWFTGNETVSAWKSPWTEDDYFYGTTAKIFAPNQFEADNMSLLITQVQRYGSNFFYNQSYPVERFGMQLYISYLNKQIGEVAPHNDKYYQTIENVFNVTSIYGLPLYITKNHFMNCTYFLDQVQIYSEDMSIHYTDISHWDDTFILVQPYTGVSFQSVIYLQNNFYHQPDFLYTYPKKFMHPIFTVNRAGNLTEDKFHELFDPLVMGLTFKSVIVYVGIVVVVVFLAMLAVSTYYLKKIKKINIDDKRQSQLGISLQQVKGLEEEPTERRVLETEEQ